MATAVANIEDRSKAVAKAPVAAGNALRAFIPNTLEEAWRLAGALANSGMTPKAYGSDQNKVMVGMLAGAEVGLTPFVALQSIAVIGGNPSLWGDGMLGLVRASGMLEDFEETDDGSKATCRVVRKGQASPIIRTFDMEQAKKAGLLGKAGPWSQYPERMRQMRARGFALRDGFADILKGLKSAEEVRDYAPIDGGTLSQSSTINAAMLADHTDDDGEGPSDTDRGESHNGTDADHPMRATVDAFLDKLRMAKTSAGVDAMLRELDRDALSEDLLIEVDAAVSDARAVL